MIKIGVIGTGAMGKNHTRVCSEIPDIELIGVYDINKENAENTAKKFNIKTYNSYQELLQHIDAAIIATPTNMHYEITKKALEQGKHVLVEKPICDTIHKAEYIIKKAEKQKLVLSVGHIERYNPAITFIKEGINKKLYGDLINLNSQRVSNLPNRIKDIGVILDFGIHDIDIMRYLAGEIISVYTKAGIYNHNINHEDYATILLNFKNNICGIININWLTPIKIRKLFLTCSQQFIEINYINQSIALSSSYFKTINEMNLYHVPMQYTTKYIELEKKEPLKNEIQDFIDAINKNKQPLSTGYDGLTALQVAYAAIKSCKTGEVIKL